MARASTSESRVCGQLPPKKCDTCIYIKNGDKASNKLFKLLKDNKDVKVQDIFNLRDPAELISVDDFCKELIVYNSTLRFLQSSMQAYMATPVHRDNSVISREGNKAKNYLTRILKSQEMIAKAVSHMSAATNKTYSEENGQTSVLKPLQDAQEIYNYTSQVANKLNTVFRQLFNSQCKGNNLTKKRGRKSADKGKGSDKCENKDKCKNKGGKNKKGNNKNKKSQKKATQ